MTSVRRRTDAEPMNERRAAATADSRRWIARCRQVPVRVTATTTPDARGAACRTPLPSPQQAFLILILLSTCCSVEGCWRRRSAPVTATVRQPPGEMTTDASPKLECTAAEAATMNCLNDGVCFVVEMVNQRVPGCICTPDWVGSNCERKYFDPDYWAASYEMRVYTTVGIVVGVFGLVIAVLLAIIVAYLCHRHRRRTYDLKRQQQEVELAR